MGYRLRSLSQILLRLILLGLGVCAVFIGWRALLHYGPQGSETKSALFSYHAKALVHFRVPLPRPATDLVLPVPHPMSSADVQLRLMKWREGEAWLPTALACGTPGKGGLHLRAGELDLVDIVKVSPVRMENGQRLCQVTCTVRWALPEDLQELLRVKDIVELKLPKGLGPGQSGRIVCTFAQQGWQWELASAESPWGGTLEPMPRARTWADWLF